MGKGIDKKGVTTWIQTTAQKLGYNHAYLASKTGISKFTIGSFMTGARAPRLDHLQKLCKAFGVEADDIARQYGYYPKPNRKRKPAAFMAVAPKTEEKKEENTMPTNTIIAEVPRPTEPAEAPKTRVASWDTRGITKESREEFGRWFSALQKNSGFKVHEYAELLGVAPTNISGYKTGKAMPCLATLQVICKQHGFNWQVAACYFGYREYKAPDHWLGKDYKTNEDWMKIQNMCRIGKCTADSIAKHAEKPNHDMEYLKSRVEELENELQAEKDRSVQELNAVEERWKKLSKEHADAEAALKAENRDLRADNAKLGEALGAEHMYADAEKYLVALQHHIRKGLPKAERVEVSCPGGADIRWNVKLPGMENVLTGHLAVDAFAETIIKSVRDEILSRYGLD